MIVSSGENKNILYFLANLSGDPIYINRYTEGVYYIRAIKVPICLMFSPVILCLNPP